MDYFTHEDYSSFNFANFMQSNLPTLHSTTFLANLQNYPTALSVQEFSPNASCISNNSTSDETDVSDHQLTMIDERKQRKIISNRESARRSRMRKQKHFDELWSQVLRLKDENHNLIYKLNHVSDSHDKVLQQNTHLKEETSDLRRMVADMQMSDSYSIFRDLEEFQCNTAHLKHTFK